MTFMVDIEIIGGERRKVPVEARDASQARRLVLASVKRCAGIIVHGVSL